MCPCACVCTLIKNPSPWHQRQGRCFLCSTAEIGLKQSLALPDNTDGLLESAAYLLVFCTQSLRPAWVCVANSALVSLHCTASSRSAGCPFSCGGLFIHQLPYGGSMLGCTGTVASLDNQEAQFLISKHFGNWESMLLWISVSPKYVSLIAFYTVCGQSSAKSKSLESEMWGCPNRTPCMWE